ncbi:hypothetical protein [Spongiactinospora sp. 9N601]|uniref:hypothetical protein n=1 Tax=Spongiactinospora sp. 9N601 TaxID=3375149 RepID=UPI0037A09809
MSSLPIETQRHLIAEHGLKPWFFAQWVSIEDRNEVARRLQVPERLRHPCDFETAVQSYDPHDEEKWVWITSHAPGWTLVLFLSGRIPPPSEALSIGRQRVFEISYISGVEELDELRYIHDGEITGDIFQADEYAAHWADLPYDGMMLPEEELEHYLIIMGRVTGRFLDRECFSSEGLLCMIP